MRLISLFIIFVLLASTGLVIAQDGKVNFAGEWTFDKDKSELPSGRSGRRGRMAATKMVVKQEQNKLIVESFRTNRDGEETSSTATYTLDGEECKNETMNRISISTAEWSDDGKSLEIFSEMNFSRNGREFTMESETTWSLKDGNLILESMRSTPRGDMESKMVYKKAEAKKNSNSQ